MCTISYMGHILLFKNILELFVDLDNIAKKKDEMHDANIDCISLDLQFYFDEREEDGEKLNSESPIFRSKYSLGFEKAKPLRLNSVQSLIFRILQNSDVKRIRINKNYDIQMAHGFRKRFNTILKLKNEVNSNIAEKIIGHSVTHKLDNTYFVPTIDELFNEFKKAIPELTISEALRLKEQNKLKDEKIKTLESDRNRIAELEDKVKSLVTLYELSKAS